MSQAIHIEDRRKKNRLIAILIALVFHITILVIAWFWMAWMRPIPEEVLIPEGVVVGFGGGEEGGGTDDLTSAAAPPADPNAPVNPDQPQEEIPTTPQPPAPNAPPVVSGGDEANTTPAPTPTPKPAIRNTYTPRTPGTGTAPTGGAQSGGGPGTGGGHGNATGPGTGTGGPGDGGGAIQGGVSGWKWKQTPNPQPCASNYTGTGYATYRIELSMDGKIESLTLIKTTVPPTVEDCMRETIRRQSKFEEIGDNTINSSGNITIHMNYGQ